MQRNHRSSDSWFITVTHLPFSTIGTKTKPRKVQINCSFSWSNSVKTLNIRTKHFDELKLVQRTDNQIILLPWMPSCQRSFNFCVAPFLPIYNLVCVRVPHADISASLSCRQEHLVRWQLHRSNGTLRTGQFLENFQRNTAFMNVNISG